MKSLYLLRIMIVGGLLLTTVCAKAQMVGNNVFLRGKYVELGVGQSGYYGSDTAAPAGYHSHVVGGGGKIGFVADPLMTGWSTGPGAHYAGDYFLPGSPFEGWELQENGKWIQAYDGGTLPFDYWGGMPVCSGANLSYSTSGSTVVGIWQGLADSISITQITTLDTNDFYFTVTINLTNLAVAPKNDLFYWRSVDPDNDESWPGGSFVTHNVIEYQMPDTAGVSMVSALGEASDSEYLALGTTDTLSRVVIYTAWGLSVSVDLSTVYNETYHGGATFYDVDTDHVGDIAIGLVISIPHLATVDSAGDSVLRVTSTAELHPANSATITYFYAFSHAGADSAIAHTHNPPAPITLAVQNVNTAGEVKVYPNPSTGMINISGLMLSDQLSMYDMMGREMNQDWLVTKPGVNTCSLNNVPAGVYVLLVRDGNGNIRSRVPVRKI